MSAINIKFVWDMAETANYVLQLNDYPMITRLQVCNLGTETLRDVKLKIMSPAKDLLLPFEVHIDLLPAGQTLDIPQARNLLLNGQTLAELRSTISTEMVISITKEDQELYAEARRFRVTPFNYWKSIESHTELLASFVVPGIKVVEEIAKLTSEKLSQQGLHSSRVGYYSDKNTVNACIAAAYAAIQDQQIGYAVSPALHTQNDGQRIRLPNEMMREGAEAGNCIEMSCFMASVLENLGLYPILVLVPGHCFAGCWLERRVFSQPVITDLQQVKKHVEAQELVVVECTLMNASEHRTSYESAKKYAEKELAESFECVVDVVAARRCSKKVHSLPIRESENGGYTVQACFLEEDLTPAPLEDVTPDEGTPTVYTKVEQWERRLLGIDLRNALLNAGFNKRSTIPLYCGSMTELTDALLSADPGVFELHTRAEVDNPPATFEDLTVFEVPPQELDLTQQRLRSPITNEEIAKRCKALAKAAKLSLEERGSNPLFLTAGMLRWYEEKDKNRETPRYAPILLYPVELIPGNATNKLQLRDQEVMLNATLMEMLKQRFKLQLPAWETLPARDNGGIDIVKVITSLRHAVCDQLGWELLNTVTIGNYDFADFKMWSDIHKNEEVLKNNKLVNSMIEGRITFETDDAHFESGSPENKDVLPVRTDASQQFAIETAVGGYTFALHGPAGTGKSECITGTIAVKMGNGEKVALTTEKKAATDVPRSRLEAMGLGDFVLDLHSGSRFDKSRVLEQLGHVLELAEQPAEPDRQYEKKVSKFNTVKDNLDSYATALHTPHPCGMSLYELTTAYGELDKADTGSFWLDPEKVSAPELFTAQTLGRQEELLHRLGTMEKVIGNPANHALRHVTGTSYSQEYKQKMIAAAIGYKLALEQAAQSSETFAETCDLPKANTYAELCSFADLADQMIRWRNLPRNWSDDANLSDRMQPLMELSRLHSKAEALKTQLLDSWNEDILSVDHKQLIAEYNHAANTHALLSKYYLDKLHRKLQPLRKESVMHEDLGKHLQQLRDYHSCVEKAAVLERENATVLQASFGNPPYDWDAVNDTVFAAINSDFKISTLTKDESHSFRTRNAGNEASIEASAALSDSWEALTEKREHFCSTLGLRPTTGGADWIESEIHRCEAMIGQIDMLKDWTALNRLCNELDECGMDCVSSAFRKGVNAQAISTAYMKTVYQKLIANIIDCDATLSHFNGTVFSDQIEQLRALDKEMVELSRKEINAKVISNIRQVVASAKKEGTELNSLKKIIRSRGRGMTLRQIFHQHLGLIRELCPCMMFSPASMAQYLPMENGLFDLVIFDEASQIPSARAVGALARGNSAMIVGDVNQMPPTTFFTGNMVDENNLDTEDLESMLDDCLALNIPSAYLKWHYRSRHESLIEFSNKRFYDNKLLTFPSATDRNSHVHLHMISDGVFESGGTRRNPKEAEAMIAYLREHAAGPNSHMSVGMITFNVEQQRLVEELLQKACREDAALAAWCDRVAEPMFIKNLENVQGDERDVILLSINYGPDKNGHVSLNFGPLNKDGGWRRLNVAISRAREQMEVFTSLRPEQIDMSKTSARGVLELRNFLEFAGGRQLPVDRSTLQLISAPGGIAENLCFRLEEAGYKAVRNVGCSDLRVDVGIVHPQHPDQYIMGILLDGSSYAAAKTTRDRELSQADVLHDLGWNIRRIWTIDWYDNREKELATLLAELEQLCQPTPAA